MNRLLLILTLAGTACAATVQAETGYLRAVGPAPLRFQKPIRLAVATPLPSLPMSPPPPAEDSDDTQPKAAPAGTDAAAPVPLPEPEGPPPPPATETPAPQPQSAPMDGLGTESTRMTPQMLLQFFQNQPTQNPQNPDKTDSMRTSVIAPLYFTPPQPITAPSSSATYNSR